MAGDPCVIVTVSPAARRRVRQPFGAVDGAMLATRAAERDRQMFEPARLVAGNRDVDHATNRVQELLDARLVAQVSDDRFIPTGQRPASFEPARIRKAPAVEHESTAVAPFVDRIAARRITERRDVHREHDADTVSLSAMQSGRPELLCDEHAAIKSIAAPRPIAPGGFRVSQDRFRIRFASADMLRP